MTSVRVVHSGVDPRESDRSGEGIERDPQTGICRARRRERTQRPMRCGPRASKTNPASADFASLGHLIGRSPSPGRGPWPPGWRETR